MGQSRRNRIGRNDPCPCGSGRKYKRCHGAQWHALDPELRGAPDPKTVQTMLRKLEAKEALRTSQQGRGRPIIAGTLQGYQFVAVGSMLHYGKWKTFHDFLFQYIRTVLGEDWGNAELKKPLEERHPILQWYDAVCHYQEQTILEPGKVHTAPITGATAAYLGLSYNLYLLAHNVELQARLVKRLRNLDQFRGAYYEALVAGCFILAGFDLALEDESDPTVSHCEFTATSQETGRSYSVEAKSRGPGKAHADVGRQLANALRKAASHSRIVLVDVNLPDDPARPPREMAEEVVSRIKNRESMQINGRPAPPAYVIVTNHPYHYDLEGTGSNRAFVGEGFKIPDFGYSAQFKSLIEAFKSKRRHGDVFDLIAAFRDYHIPSTFDGEVPEFAFGEADRRFTIGESYDLSDFEPGATGELTTGCVSPDGRQARLAFRLADGRSVIAASELSEAEASAYRQHPETFFGERINPGTRIEDALGLFEFFYNSYKSAPRERILGFLEAASNMEELVNLPTEELLLILCEGWVASAMAQQAAGGAQPPKPGTTRQGDT